MMGLLDRVLRRIRPSPQIVGCWQLVRATQDSGEPAEADFRADGRLFYSVLSSDRWQIMKLRYEVHGDVLLTDQPSSPRMEQTRFALEENGELILELGGQRSRFRRGLKVAPEP